MNGTPAGGQRYDGKRNECGHASRDGEVGGRQNLKIAKVMTGKERRRVEVQTEVLGIRVLDD